VRRRLWIPWLASVALTCLIPSVDSGRAIAWAAGALPAPQIAAPLADCTATPQDPSCQPLDTPTATTTISVTPTDAVTEAATTTSTSTGTATPTSTGTATASTTPTSPPAVSSGG